MMATKGRGTPTEQSADHLRAFADRLTSCANALNAVADQMDASKIKRIVCFEGHAMAYRSIEQYLEKFIQEVRKGLTRFRKDRGDFGGDGG